MSSEPRGILGSRGRTLSETKNFNYKKKLARIDENVKKPYNSTLKSKMYFKSPEKSDRSISK
jgi:hypothetical protein